MKHKKHLLIVLSVFLIFFQLSAGENIIQNGDFEMIEADFPVMWTTNTWKNDPNGVKFYLNHDKPHSGKNYITIENLISDDSKLIQYVPVKSNTTYKLSCWIKAQGISENALGANITCLDILSVSKDYKDTNGEWKYVELYGKTNAKQKELTITARLGGYGNINTGKASFDDISLEEVTEVPAGIQSVQFYKSDSPSKPSKPSITFNFTYSTLPMMIIISLLYILFLFIFYRQGLKNKNILQYDENKANLILYIGLFFALFLRIFLAPIVEGYPNDIACFKGWALSASDNGLGKFYNSGQFADYPPGYIYILYILGFIRKLFSISHDSSTFLTMIKLPSIITDIASGYLIYYMAKKETKSSSLGVILAFFYVINPAIIHNSTIYGQVDSYFTFFILLALFFIYRNKFEIASIIFAYAVLIKPQALIFAPIAVIALVDLYLIHKNLKTILFSIISFIATFILLILPFSFGQSNPFWIFKLFGSTLGSYEYASLNAYNLFSLLGANWLDDKQLFLFLPYKVWGTIFIILSVIAAGGFYWMNYKREKKQSLLFYLSFFMITAFYVLAHKVHERYLFPAIALVLLCFITTKDKRFLYLLGGLSITLFFNQETLLNMAVKKKEFWIPKDDVILRLFSAVNVACLIYTIKIGIDIYIKNITYPIKVIDMKSTKQTYEKIDAATEISESTIAANDNKLELKKKDFILMGGLTLVYALIALINLGSCKAPQTYWQPANRGASFYVDLGEEKNIERIYSFLSLGKGTYRIEFSNDHEKWDNTQTIQQKSQYDMIEWRFLTLNVTARYVKISTEEPGSMLNELGIYEKGKKTPLPIKQIIPLTSNSLDKGKPEYVFDEQNTIGYIPSYWNGMYFDEVYHARTGYETVHRMEPSETTHPPLGKDIIGLGIMLFGMTPFGWRIMGTLMGIIMIPIMYLFGKRLFKKSEYAFIPAFLFAFDFLHFVQTRIATIDVYGVFFIILMFYYMYQYFTMNFYQVELKKTFYPLLMSGIFFGLGAAAKWITIYGAVGLAILFFISIGTRTYEFFNAKHMLSENIKSLTKNEKKQYRTIIDLYPRNTTFTFLACILFFIIIPVILYVMSYIPFMMVPGPGHELINVYKYQGFMYDYHSKLVATHPFSSNWYEWPIMKRPVWYFGGQNYLPADKVSSIVALGNPAIWWIGMFAVIAAVFIAITKKNKSMIFILIALASQYLPWAISPRKLVFLYHFFATVPFMIICITYILIELKNNNPKFKYFIYSYLGIVLLLFILFYPILSGMVVDKSYVQKILHWFNSWVFYT